MKLKAYHKNLIFNSLALSVLSLLMENALADPPPLLPEVTNSDYHYEGEPGAQKVQLGKFLFFDKILSGNKDISCGTCHNPQFGTGDSLSLPIGTGGDGGGQLRVANTAPSRVPRHTLSLYNSGAKEFTAFSSDGDFMLSPSGQFIFPGGNPLPPNLENLLAVQALFPMTAPREMAGLQLSNDIAIACPLPADFVCIWNKLAERVQDIPEYVTLFKAVFPGVVSAGDINIGHVANALAAYESVAFRSDDSPFDKYLRLGDSRVMSESALAGMDLFYGSAGCSTCHSGVFQTDHSFHAIAMPHLGSGRKDGITGKDQGRYRITFDFADMHSYKTPSLRNVVLTSPYGHAGAYSSLEAVVRHHLNPPVALQNYDKNQAVLPPFPLVPFVAATDFVEYDNLNSRAQRAASNDLAPMSLSDEQVNQLLAFLRALTGESVLDVKDKMPFTVPSGLPVAD